MNHRKLQNLRPDREYPVDLDFDPLDPNYLTDPYPFFTKFCEEVPIFYAPKVDFWVVSRYEDIGR